MSVSAGRQLIFGEPIRSCKSSHLAPGDDYIGPISLSNPSSSGGGTRLMISARKESAPHDAHCKPPCPARPLAVRQSPRVSARHAQSLHALRSRVRRRCLGDSFAMLEAMLELATVVP